MSASALPAPTDPAAARRVRAELARRDPGVFAEYVLRDEATGAPVELAPMHREWFRLIRQYKRLVILATPIAEVISIGQSR